MENVEENEKMSKGYAELTELVRPYIDDFAGYNEELGGFDIVLCVKELLQQFDNIREENKKLKESRDYYKRIVDGCPEVCEDGFCLIDSYNKKLSKTIATIKEIAEPFCNACQEHEPEKSGRDCMYCNYGKILQKIKECEGTNE